MVEIAKHKYIEIERQTTKCASCGLTKAHPVHRLNDPATIVHGTARPTKVG